VQIEWGGKVQRVVDGEAHTFETWEALLQVILSMLSDVHTGYENTGATNKGGENELA